MSHKWIVKNEEKETPPKPFEERIAPYMEECAKMTDEELLAIRTDKGNPNDLIQAARVTYNHRHPRPREEMYTERIWN